MAGAFEANSRHIARCAARPCPAPQPPNSVTPAFEAFAYLKIVNELRSDNTIVRRKAVIAVRELLVQPTQHIQCIAAGVAPALVQLLSVPDADLQVEAASSLGLLMRKEVGCRDALQHAALPALLQLLRPQDNAPAVRDAALAALVGAAGFEPLRAALVQEQGALAALLRQAQQEDAPGRSAQELALLHNCTQGRRQQDALPQLSAAQAVPRLAVMISSSSSSSSGGSDDAKGVRLLAVKLLGDLALTQPDSRKQAVEAGCVPVLLGLLTDDQQQACAAASALAMIALAKEGKVAVHEAQGAGMIVEALRRAAMPAAADALLLINLLQLLTLAAEFPACRQHLADSGIVGVVEQLKKASLDELLKKAAADALRVLSAARH